MLENQCLWSHFSEALNSVGPQACRVCSFSAQPVIFSSYEVSHRNICSCSGPLRHILEPVVAPLPCTHEEQGVSNQTGLMKQARWRIPRRSSPPLCSLKPKERRRLPHRVETRLWVWFAFEGTDGKQTVWDCFVGLFGRSLPCWNITLQRLEWLPLGFGSFVRERGPCFETPVAASCHDQLRWLRCLLVS